MTDKLSYYVTDSVAKVVRQDPLNILGLITNPLVQLTVWLRFECHRGLMSMWY